MWASGCVCGRESGRGYTDVSVPASYRAKVGRWAGGKGGE